MTYPTELRELAEGLAIAQLTNIYDDCPNWHEAYLELENSDYDQTEFKYFEPTEALDHLNGEELFAVIDGEGSSILYHLEIAYDMGAKSK